MMNSPLWREADTATPATYSPQKIDVDPVLGDPPGTDISEPPAIDPANSVDISPWRLLLNWVLVLGTVGVILAALGWR